MATAGRYVLGNVEELTKSFANKLTKQLRRTRSPECHFFCRFSDSLNRRLVGSQRGRWLQIETKLDEQTDDVKSVCNIAARR